MFGWSCFIWKWSFAVVASCLKRAPQKVQISQLLLFLSVHSRVLLLSSVVIIRMFLLLFVDESIIWNVLLYIICLTAIILTEVDLIRGHQASRTLQPSAFERVSVRCCRSVPGSSQTSPGASSIFGKAWIILAMP